MSSLKTSIRNQEGFTMLEILIVMAMVAVFGVIGIFLSGDMYRSSSFNSDAGALAVSLQRARSQAVNNINEKSHGLKILNNGDYVIFEGPNYSSNPATYEVIKGNSGFVFTGPAFTNPDGVVFEQLSGACPLCTGNITVSDGGSKLTTIILNTEGRIDW